MELEALDPGVTSFFDKYINTGFSVRFWYVLHSQLVVHCYTFVSVTCICFSLLDSIDHIYIKAGATQTTLDVLRNVSSFLFLLPVSFCLPFFFSFSFHIFIFILLSWLYPVSLLLWYHYNSLNICIDFFYRNPIQSTNLI